MKLPSSAFLGLIILVVVAYASVVDVVSEKKEDQSRNLNVDLQSYAQLQCSSMHQYTTASSLVYTDNEVSNGFDDILKNHSMTRNHSHVILVTHVKPPLPQFVHLTGTNTGLGTGMTNGLPRAQRYISHKQRVQPFFPMHHPRQNMSFCSHVSRLAELGTSSFYQHMKEDTAQPYVTILRNAVVSSEGHVALECGWLQHRQSCCNRVLKTGRTWRAELSSYINAQYPYEKDAWSGMNSLKHALSSSGRSTPVYDEVFVIDAAWDFNYYHFLVESITRLIPFYNYLQRNAHIKIHIRAHENTMNMSDPIKVKRALDGTKIRQRLFQLLEIAPSRIINGTVLARKLYFPSDVECASPLKHSTELNVLSGLLKTKADKVLQRSTCNTSWKLSPPHTTSTYHTSHITLPASQAKIIIQARDCYNTTLPGYGKVRNSEKWRCFTAQQLDLLKGSAEVVFPQSDVAIARTSLTHPLACDIHLYSTAEVVIGLHGAAMTNVMFMRPGTVLVEIVGQFDPRMPPVCGSFGPYSAAFGVHHFIYYFDGVIEGALLDIQDVLHQAYEFYSQIRLNVSYTSYNLTPF